MIGINMAVMQSPTMQNASRGFAYQCFKNEEKICDRAETNRRRSAIAQAADEASGVLLGRDTTRRLQQRPSKAAIWHNSDVTWWLHDLGAEDSLERWWYYLRPASH
jgi:hypothetical protein